MKTITIHNLTWTRDYEVMVEYSDHRAIIRYEDGLFVLAERQDDGRWELFGGTPTPEENQEIYRLIAESGTLDTTMVDVIPPTSGR